MTRQVMHNWPKDPHQETHAHQLAGRRQSTPVDEANCWCDPKVMEWDPQRGWVTLRGSRR